MSDLGDRIPQLPEAARRVFASFSEMSQRDQLMTFQVISRHLREGGGDPVVDPQLERRAESLDALRRVVEHLRLEDPRTLGTAQFDSAPESVRNGWRSGRVIRAWATWRFALDALSGEKPRPTAQQRSIRRAVGANFVRSEDYIASVADWLSTEPLRTTIKAYDEWALKRNIENPDSLPCPTAGTVRIRLELPWRTVIEVAEGKVSLGEAKKRPRRQKLAWTTTEHDLVSQVDIRQMSGQTKAQVAKWMNDSGFPTPVLIKQKWRLYHRADVQAFLDRKPFPTREENELGAIYLDRHEAAKLRGFSPVGYAAKEGPAPVLNAGGMNLWLRADIEATVAAGRVKTKGANRIRPTKAKSGQ